MKLIIVLSAVLLRTAIAGVDYSKCAQVIETSALEEWGGFPFQVSSKGEVSLYKGPDKKLQKAASRLSVSTKKSGKYREMSISMPGMWKYLIRMDSQSKIQELTKEVGPENRPISTVYKLQNRNGQCVVSKILVNTTEQKAPDTTMADLDLCKEIDTFFKKNQKASACYNESLNNQMASIINKHVKPKSGVDYYATMLRPISLERFAVESLNAVTRLDKKLSGELIRRERPMGSRVPRTRTPLVIGDIVLSDCRRFHRFGLFIDDPKVWEGQTLNSSTENSSSILEGQK